MFGKSPVDLDSRAWVARTLSDIRPRLSGFARAVCRRRKPRRSFGEEDPPAWISPRDAFGLWVYGEVVHDDYAKELRWRRLDDTFGKPAVRSMAHDFATLMIGQAESLNRLIRHGLIEPISTNDRSARWGRPYLTTGHHQRL